MSIGSLSTADKAKLQHLINDGVQAFSDIANMKEGLKETVDAIAEELDIKKTVLNKAIRIAYKRSLNKDELSAGREELDEVEEILSAAGKP
jgi:hypothetical protein